MTIWIQHARKGGLLWGVVGLAACAVDTLYPIVDRDIDTEVDVSSSPASDKRVPWVGSATQDGTFPDDFFDLWNQVTPENAGKWGVVEPFRDGMQWDTMDHIYRRAIDSDAVFKQHTLVWGRQQPFWMSSLNEEEQSEELEEWIQAVCARYPDTHLLNVVSEPLNTPPDYIDALGGAGETGYDWVIAVYEMAREHCSDAELLLNEYNALQWNTEMVATLATLLNDRGLIDGIGCGAHGLETADVDALEESLDRLAQIGLPLYISEYDVNIADDDVQREVLKAQFSLFYNHPAVAGITFWGYVEGFTWAQYAYLRRADGTYRPALTWLLNYLDR